MMSAGYCFSFAESRSFKNQMNVPAVNKAEQCNENELISNNTMV